MIIDWLEISIHALREEGDLLGEGIVVVNSQFLSTPSARRATRDKVIKLFDNEISIHALREEGDHFRGKLYSWLLGISIHALREEGDLSRSVIDWLYSRISIHALREEGDCDW